MLWYSGIVLSIVESVACSWCGSSLEQDKQRQRPKYRVEAPRPSGCGWRWGRVHRSFVCIFYLLNCQQPSYSPLSSFARFLSSHPLLSPSLFLLTLWLNKPPICLCSLYRLLAGRPRRGGEGGVGSDGTDGRRCQWSEKNDCWKNVAGVVRAVVAFVKSVCQHTACWRTWRRSWNWSWRDGEDGGYGGAVAAIEVGDIERYKQVSWRTVRATLPGNSSS